MKEREKRYLLNQLYQPFWDPEHSWRPPAAGREGEGRPAADVRAVLQWRKQPADLLDADPGTGCGGGNQGEDRGQRAESKGAASGGAGMQCPGPRYLDPNCPSPLPSPRERGKTLLKSLSKWTSSSFNSIRVNDHKEFQDTFQHKTNHKN